MATVAGSLKQWRETVWVAVTLSKCKNFIWTFPTSNAALSVVTGFKQVCPPAVKLQNTWMASDVQPRFGSIQNNPSLILCRQSSRSLQKRAGFSLVPSCVFMPSMTLLRYRSVLKISALCSDRDASVF